ncbi:MAG: GTPase Era [Clostridiales bacterium]|nr:GTPase Era [Clostridiales bacterium]
MGYKSGFIGIIGRPNVGKSTLMNAILGEKIAIMSDKPQTTRNVIRGVYTTEDTQFVFIDTPGIHKPKNKLGTIMTENAEKTLEEVDIVLFIIDDRANLDSEDLHIIELLKNIKTSKVLVINKIDKIEPELFRKIYETYNSMGIFDEVFGTSATDKKNIDKLLQKIKELLPEGPQFFPEDILTDQHERFLVQEIIREKALHYLEDEIPHGIAVEIMSMKEENEILKIQAEIICEKKSHKGIIIGKGGRKLKGIGKSARLELEAFFGIKVFLELWVKVKENWRENDSILKNFGYYK